MTRQFTLPDLYVRLPDGRPKVTLNMICQINEYLIVDDEDKRRAQRSADTQARHAEYMRTRRG